MAGWHVTANDIREWTSTNKRRAEELLPLLIKRLILASCTPQKIDFGTGDAIAVGGWDGILEVEEGNAFVPAGKSGWEMGTNDAVKGKADSDYSKRLKNPSPFFLEETTFVFATTRLWSKKDNWVRFKQNTGKWKDVKGINAEELQDWLEACPSVHRWFSELLNKRSGTLWDIDQAWERFSNQTGIKLTTGFLLHARDSIKSSLISRLSGSARSIRISAESPKEAYGFILSSLLSDEALMSKSLIVRSQEDWDLICGCENNLILVPLGFNPDGVGLATRNGHFVITPIDNKSRRDDDILLSYQIRLDREEAFKKLELTDSQVTILFSETKGFFNPFIRHMLMQPLDLDTPQWPVNFSSDVLFAILFSTELDSNNSNDWEVLESLSGHKKTMLEELLENLARQDDPPIRKIGSLWQVISKMDYWLVIAHQINLPVLNRLLDVAVPVLSDNDPSFEIEASERVFFTAKPKYSKRLKRGIADSLALLASHGDEYSEQLGGNLPSTSIAHWAKGFFEAHNDVKFWYSLGPCSELLAEAAPKEFLSAVESSAQGQESTIKQLLLNEGGGFFGGGCHHSNLLWALESFSWSRQHFSRACKCLARLSQIDPGGKYSNRPFNSLVDIFIGWINNTIITHDERLQVLEDIILDQYPDIGWKLMNQLLINQVRISSGVSRSSYRDWGPSLEERGVSQTDYVRYVSEIVNLMINNIPAQSSGAVIDLIDNFVSYSPEQRDKIINLFLSLEVEGIEKSERHLILNKLRATLCHHREFPDSDWSWDEELLILVENVYNHFNFSDLLNANVYLFNDTWPNIVNPINRKEVGHEERTSRIETLRIGLVDTIFREHSIDGITELVKESKNSWVVADTACKSEARDLSFKSAIEWVSRPLESDLLNFARDVIWHIAYEDIDSALKVFGEKNEVWTDDVASKYLLSLPLNSSSFEVILKCGEAVKEKYWKELNIFRVPHYEQSLITSISSCLLEYNRPAAALKSVSQLFFGEKKELIDCNLLADILIAMIRCEDGSEDEAIPNIYYELNKSIRFIQKSNDVDHQVKLQIEWGFLSLSGREYSPVTLAREVASDPLFFCQLICWLYKRSDGVLEEDSHQTEVQANGAWYLLEKLDIIPGDDGSVIDGKNLLNWIISVRGELDKRGRLDSGDIQIGKLLSTCSSDDDVWPSRAICKVIEKIDSPYLFDGMVTGKLNSRGVTTRHPHAGGRQEKTLADKFSCNAQSIELTFPRTAEMLRSLSQSYSSQADEMDHRVEAGM
ncbi:MAG: hypothetical protein ACKVJE_09110 [Pseudomonadales bacterium]